MTPQERAIWVHDKWLNGGYLEVSMVEALASVIREVILEEREACVAALDRGCDCGCYESIRARP